jgi:hypothetical protein
MIDMDTGVEMRRLPSVEEECHATRVLFQQFQLIGSVVSRVAAKRVNAMDKCQSILQIFQASVLSL